MTKLHGFKTRPEALAAGRKFLARTGTKLHCGTGLCYVGHGGVFPCKCGPALAQLPEG